MLERFGMSMIMGGHISSEGSYRVESKYGCRIIWGSVPVTDLLKLMEGENEELLVATDIASKIGASFVIGRKDNLEAMRNDHQLPVSPKRLAEAEKALRDGWPMSFSDWLTDGDRGRSSDAIAQRVTGIGDIHGKPNISHPYDACDFKRCLAVIEALTGDKISEGDILTKMITVSPEWRAIIWSWASLMASKNNPKVVSMIIKQALESAKEESL